MKDYRQMVLSVPGGQMPNPVTIAPSAVLKFELPQDEPEALFSVVLVSSFRIPPSTSRLSCRMAAPFRKEQLGADAGAWTSVRRKGASDDSITEDIFANLLLMRVAGYHHLIHLSMARKGAYEIRAAVVSEPLCLRSRRYAYEPRQGPQGVRRQAGEHRYSTTKVLGDAEADARSRRRSRPILHRNQRHFGGGAAVTQEIALDVSPQDIAPARH
jgi:hypothetical protein